MIKLFCGEDTYESYTNAQKLAKTLAKEKQIETKIINSDELSDPSEILIEIEGVGMFSSSKVILLKRPLSNKKLIDFLVEKFERLNEYEIILWQDSNADGKLKFVKMLKDKKQINNFDKLKAWQLEAWVENICKAKNIKLTKDQIKFIVERTEENKWFVINELRKIDLYLATDGKKNNPTLTETELSRILGLDVRGDIWKFLDYLGNKDNKNLLSEYERIINYEDNVQYLIAMINRELSILAKIVFSKENSLDLKELKLHPFVLQKTLKKSSNFKFEEIRNLLNKLFNLDLSIKSGEISDKLGLKLFLATI
jgi:DNA polymerase-3 subunit delta